MRKAVTTLLLAALTLALLFPYVPPVAQASGTADTPVFSENFESVSAGQLPAGWTAATGGGPVSVTEDTYGNHRLTIRQSANGQGDSAAISFSPISGTATATVDMRIMAEQTGQSANFLTLKDSNGAKIVELLYDLDYAGNGSRHLARRTPDGNWSNLQNYEANRWYDVHVAVDLAAGTYGVSVDGTAVADDIPLLVPAGDIAAFETSAYRWGNGVYHIDDIAVAKSSGNDAPRAVDVAITGTAAVGMQLGGAYTYNDAEGDPEGATALQWYGGANADGSDKTPLAGASSRTYTPTPEDAGNYLFFEVTPVAASGDAQGLPVLSAPVRVRQSSDILYSENFEGTEIGQLPEGWTKGADNDPVSVTAEPSGNRRLTVKETANAVTSSAKVGLASVQGRVSLDMRVMAEQTGASANFLTLKDSAGVTFIELLYDQDYDHTGRHQIARRTPDGNWSSLQPYSAGRWYAVHLDIDMDADTYNIAIDGAQIATGVAFLAPANDIAEYSISAYRYQAGVYHVDDLSLSLPVNQPPTAKNVTIAGTAAVGMTLTGNYTFSDPEGDDEAESAFQWYVGTAADGSDKSAIDGATARTYTVAADDEGKYIFFGVTPAALTGGAIGALAVSPPVLAAEAPEPDAETYLTFDKLPAEIGKGRFSPIARTTQPVALDGDFEKWRSFTGVKLGDPSALTYAGWNGDADLSAEAYYTYDANNFYFAVKATDDVAFPLPGGSNWSGDGVQFAFGEPAFASFHTEYGVAFDGTSADIVRYNDGMASLTPDSIQAHFTRSGNDTIYEMAIPWGAVMSTAPAPGQIVPFTFLVNDNDGSGREGYIEWTGGIGASKDVGLFARLGLMDQDDTWSSWVNGADRVNSGESPQFTLYVPNYGDEPLNVTLDIPSYGVSGEPVAIPAGQLLRKTFSVRIDSPRTITVSIAEPSTGKMRQETHRVEMVMTAQDIAAKLDRIEADNEGLQDKLSQAAAQGFTTDYETVNETVIANFLVYARQDLDQNDPALQSRAQYMAGVLEELVRETGEKLDAYLAGTAQPLAVPRYVTGPTSIENYSVIGNTTTEADRPIFFTGYGMFGQVITDIPKFTGYGTNIIDYNIYPNEVIFADPSSPSGFKVSTAKIDNVLKPALANAAANNIAVNIDLAPHGFPDSLFAEFPDLRNPDNLYAHKFDFEHPKAAEVLQAYIDAVIPAIKDSPALKGITLTSEPNYFKNNGVYHLNNWHLYLADHYASVADMNAMYGTSYASFDDVPVADVDQVVGSPYYYDYLTFKTEQFDQFHQMLADRVHLYAPDLPVHIKIMGYGATHRDPMLKWGYDLEAFSEMTDMSGDDNGILQEEGSQGYLNALGLYDLQSSLARQPVFNSEDHVITDGDPRYIPEIADSVQNSIWAGALHGRTLSTIWTWQRDYSGNRNWSDSIMNRPDAAAGVGKANLDLNRLAREVTAFQEAPANVALLYSFTPNLYSDDYFGTLQKAYGALSYTGQKVGFVTEKQIVDPDRPALDSYKLLVLPEVTNLSADTLAAIRSWVEGGGHVMTIGAASTLLQGDEHDLPLPAADRDAILGSANTTQIAPNPSQESLRSSFFAILEQLGLNKVVVYDAATNEPVNEVEWRTADYGGETLLSLINFSDIDKNVYVKVNGVQATPVRDLLAEADNNASTLALNGLGHSLYTLPSDHEPPVVTFSGGGDYTIDRQVTIACSAADAGSGLASDPCVEPLVDAPAYTLGLGGHTVAVDAVDNAGNEAHATVGYSVKVTLQSLINLILQWIEGHGTHGGNGVDNMNRMNSMNGMNGMNGLNEGDRVANSLAVKLQHGNYGAFKQEVAAKAGKLLTGEQAELLKQAADALAANGS